MEVLADNNKSFIAFRKTTANYFTVETGIIGTKCEYVSFQKTRWKLSVRRKHVPNECDKRCFKIAICCKKILCCIDEDLVDMCLVDDEP